MRHSLLVVPSPHLLSNLSDPPLTTSPTRRNSNIRTYPPAYHQPYFPSHPSDHHTPAKPRSQPLYTANITPIAFPINDEISLIIHSYSLTVLSRNTPKAPQKCRKKAAVTLQKRCIFIIFTLFLLIFAQFLTVFCKFPAIFTKSLHFTTFRSIIGYKERGGSGS